MTYTEKMREEFDKFYERGHINQHDRNEIADWWIFSSHQAVANEVDRAKGGTIDRVEELMKCGECDGTGAYSSPSSFDPCSHCEGTGVYIEGCFSDVLALLKREKEKND